MEHTEKQGKTSHISEETNIKENECGELLELTIEDKEAIAQIDIQPHLTEKGKQIKKLEYIASVRILKALSGMPVKSIEKVLADCSKIVLERSIFTNR